MAKNFACALTHVRHESFFLAKWISHYGSPATRPRPAHVAGAQGKGLYVKLPHTFAALV